MPADESKKQKPPPTSRSYEHRHCGGVTEVSGEDFGRLVNPFTFVWGQTYCANCDSDISLEDVYWTNTGESLGDYRRRQRAKAPASMKFVGWVGVPVFGFLFGSLIGWLIVRDFWFGFMAFGAIGGLFSAAFSMPLLTTYLWEIDYRRKK